MRREEKQNEEAARVQQYMEQQLRARRAAFFYFFSCRIRVGAVMQTVTCFKGKKTATLKRRSTDHFNLTLLNVRANRIRLAYETTKRF